MSDPDYTCFDRLYDDALRPGLRGMERSRLSVTFLTVRRMDKQRRLEWYRLGNTGEPPPTFKAEDACSMHAACMQRACAFVE